VRLHRDIARREGPLFIFPSPAGGPEALAPRSLADAHSRNAKASSGGRCLVYCLCAEPSLAPRESGGIGLGFEGQIARVERSGLQRDVELEQLVPAKEDRLDRLQRIGA